jgi:hypothetical protein
LTPFFSLSLEVSLLVLMNLLQNAAAVLGKMKSINSEALLTLLCSASLHLAEVNSYFFFVFLFFVGRY